MQAHELESEPVEDPEIRRAKFVLFVFVVLVLSIAIAVMLVFFQPHDQLVVERWPNGYPKNETHYVLDSLHGKLAQGAHRAWHENGQLAEEGEHAHGLRVGIWHFWDDGGRLDDASSGLYVEGRRERALEADER
jgi:hypothetical protein